MVTVRNVLERAKQGEPEAISALMNKTLNAKGMHVQVRQRGSEYQLLVEAKQAPAKQEMVPWVMQGLRRLAITRLETVTIYGKSQQSSKPNWQYRTRIVSQNPRPDSTNELSPQKLQVASAEPSLDLSEYCFTRNQSLLRGKLTLPSKPVCKAVIAFALLPNAQKLAVMPHCTKLLCKPEPVEEAALEKESQEWIEQVINLESNDLRKLSIWLSRYCVEPAETIEQLKHRIEPVPKPAEVAETDKAAAPTHVDSASVNAQTMYSSNAPVQGLVSSSRIRPEAISQKASFSQDSRIPAWLFPVVCTVGLVIAITLGIQSVDEMAYAFPMCEESTASSESCILAVQMVDSNLDFAIAKSESEPAVTPDIQAEAIENCREIAADDYAPYDAAFYESEAYQLGEVEAGAIEVSTSKTQSIFPGMLLTEIVQKDSNLEGVINRVACLDYVKTYSNADAINDRVTAGDIGLASLAADVIPMDWPAQEYADMSEFEVSTAKALGIYDVFISFGSNTLFTAVGIFIAVLFCSCYRCYTYQGVYQMASVLAIIETTLLMIPVFGFFARVAMNVLAVGLASRFVKDFHIDWTEGYNSLALGVGIITGVRSVLSLILYAVITYFVVA